MRYLSNRPRPEVPPDAVYEGQPPEESPLRIDINHKSLSDADSSRTIAADHRAHSTDHVSIAPINQSAKPTPNKPFTKEDRQLLEDIYDDILNIDEGKVIAAWNAWAEEVGALPTFKLFI